MIHTVEGFGVVIEAEVDVFLEFPCLFYDPTDVGNLISGFSAFCKSSLYIRKFFGSHTGKGDMGEGKKSPVLKLCL